MISKKAKGLQRWALRVLRTAFPIVEKRLLQRDITSEFRRAISFQQGEFPARLTLPPNFGKALPERAPELLLAALSYQPGLKILDTGYANAMQCHLDMIASLAAPKNFIGLDIAPSSYNATPYYNKTMTADLADELPTSERFDLIWCISTLEHIGMDNSSYQKKSRLEDAADFKAVSNMLRLLSNNGRLLITVPYGKLENHGWLRNYDCERWRKILDTAHGFTKVTQWYFKHTHGVGWILCEAAELRHVGYYDQQNSGAAGMAAALIQKTNDSNI